MKKKLALNRLTVRHLETLATTAVDGNGISIVPTVFCRTHTCISCYGSCYDTCLGGIC
ncbi:MAG TPA: hypothetical protein VN783_16085 [Thermoanaerobaculia bacterium]|nr:hypothetical protein [Thermoanaerobaculia bacterium]